MKTIKVNPNEYAIVITTKSTFVINDQGVFSKKALENIARYFDSETFEDNFGEVLNVISFPAKEVKEIMDKNECYFNQRGVGVLSSNSREDFIKKIEENIYNMQKADVIIDFKIDYNELQLMELHCIKVERNHSRDGVYIAQINLGTTTLNYVK